MWSVGPATDVCGLPADVLIQPPLCQSTISPPYPFSHWPPARGVPAPLHWHFLAGRAGVVVTARHVAQAEPQPSAVLGSLGCIVGTIQCTAWEGPWYLPPGCHGRVDEVPWETMPRWSLLCSPFLNLIPFFSPLPCSLWDLSSPPRVWTLGPRSESSESVTTGPLGISLNLTSFYTQMLLLVTRFADPLPLPLSSSPKNQRAVLLEQTLALDTRFCGWAESFAREQERVSSGDDGQRWITSDWGSRVSCTLWFPHALGVLAKSVSHQIWK